MKNAALRHLTGVALLGLAACASPPASPPASGPGSQPENRTTALAPANWQGKLGYRIDEGAYSPAQAGSVGFSLQGAPQAGRLQLSSPLGSTVALAEWDASGVRLHDGRDTRHYPDLQALGEALGSALDGTPMPLLALFDWLQGRPQATAPHSPLPAAQGEAFLQAGWHVRRPSPQRLELQRPAEHGQGAVRITLVWQP